MLEVLKTAKLCTENDTPKALGKSILAVCFLALSLTCCASHAHADNTPFTGFRGQVSDWIGSCDAELEIGPPANGISNATLSVICNNDVNVEESLSGHFDFSNGRYNAEVTAIKNITGTEYDRDLHFDLQRSEDGCTMSGTATDADGSNDVSFRSVAPGC